MSLDISLYKTKRCEIFEANITHNLNKMVDKAGIYGYLWKPDELDIKLAGDLVEPLTAGLKRLKENPDYYRQFNASNGWGKYEHLVTFVEKYLNACIENPESEIYVSR